MRTVLCSTTAGKGAFLLALVAGAVGGMTLALPASAADGTAAGGGPHVRHAAHHRTHGTATGTGRRAGTTGVLLGPATKYVRLSDGTVREVR